MSQLQVEDKELSTTTLSRKGLDGVAVIRFDSECSLCKMLADYMRRRVDSSKMSFEPSVQRQPASIAVEVVKLGETIVLTGEEAWSWILCEHPTLRELNWIAQKLGMLRLTASTLKRSSDFLRRFCSRCRP